MTEAGDLKIGEAGEANEISTSSITHAKPQDDTSNEAPVVAENAAPTRDPGFHDYIRVFSYARKWDILLMVAAALASIGAGITMPLMTTVFGNLVGGFSNLGGSNPPTEKSFRDQLNRQCLYMLALFIARFGLNYINKVPFNDFSALKTNIIETDTGF